MGNLQVIKTDFASLSYMVFPGKGDETMLFFPGFGQDQSHYKALADKLTKSYTVIVVELFFHGESKWLRQDTPMEVKEWKLLVEHLLEEQQVQRFSLMGFSMGARFAMVTTVLYEDRVDELRLAAPDGIDLNIWYSIAVSNKLFRGIFKSVVLNNSSWLRKIAETFSVMGLLDKKVYRFSFSQLQTQAQRERVYYSWVVFRKIQVSIHQLASGLRKRKIPLTFYMGEHDKIITMKRIAPLHRVIPESELVVLSSGHTHLLEAIAKEM